MLNQLPEVFAPHPPHILHTFYPLLKIYGNLQEDKNFTRLVEDVCRLVELNPVPWDNLPLERDTIMHRCRHRSLLEVFIRTYELQCEKSRKKVWCCKSMETVYHLHHFEREGHRPFFIYLYRDGRDVAASFRNILIGDKHIYFLANKWKIEQELALLFLQKLPSGAFSIIRYEDFIKEPEKYIREICEKTGVAFDKSVLAYYKSPESRKTALAGRMWENVSRPIIKNNTGKYHDRLTNEEVAIFEGEAGDMLLRLGYNNLGETAEAVPQAGFSISELLAFEEENNRLKREAWKRATPEELAHLKPRQDFIKSLQTQMELLATPDRL
ncbi:MAG: sulfotransferase [Chitinophagales bacterium]|nr:MAG: sulfotransferase [Chitinophagales bacterium]